MFESTLSCHQRLSIVHSIMMTVKGESNRLGDTVAVWQNFRLLLRYRVRGSPQFSRYAPHFLGLSGYEFFSVGVRFLPRSRYVQS